MMDEKNLEKFREVWKAVNSARIDCILEPEIYCETLEGLLGEIEASLDKYVNHATFNS